MGSGICTNIAVRDLVGKDTKTVGVLSDRVDAYARSFEAGHEVTTETADTRLSTVSRAAATAPAVVIAEENRLDGKRVAFEPTGGNVHVDNVRRAFEGT